MARPLSGANMLRMKNMAGKVSAFWRGLFMAALFPLTAGASEPVLSGLDYPWDIETHDGALFVTEKAGTIGVLDQSGFKRFPVVTSEPVLNDRGGGLMGLALHPDFETSGRVVLYQHYGTPDNRMNRVIEARQEGDRFHETRVLIDEIPGHPLYNGGRVAFGPDGMLYVTTGWTEDRKRPQDRESLAGKILRITADGDIPSDNPFSGSPVYSMGHRNPQGLAWDSAGQLFAAEHGQSGHDEVNRIIAGGNYGWPLIQGDETADGMLAPMAHSGNTTWAPSGLAWDGGRLLVAGLRTQSVVAVDENGQFAEAFSVGERVRDIVVTDDGVFAITTNRSPRRDGASADSLIRLTD